MHDCGTMWLKIRETGTHMCSCWRTHIMSRCIDWRICRHFVSVYHVTPLFLYLLTILLPYRLMQQRKYFPTNWWQDYNTAYQQYAKTRTIEWDRRCDDTRTIMIGKPAMCNCSLMLDSTSTSTSHRVLHLPLMPWWLSPTTNWFTPWKDGSR